MQPVTPSSGHSSRGSVPTDAFMHVPTLPNSAHDWHRPAHSDRQQTPSKQKPLLQPLWSAHASAMSAPGVTGASVPVLAPSPATSMPAGASLIAGRSAPASSRDAEPSPDPRASPAPPQPAASSAHRSAPRATAVPAPNNSAES